LALNTKRLVTSSSDGTLRCWDLSGDEPKPLLSWHESVPPKSMAMDPTGVLLAESYPDGTIRLSRLLGAERTELTSWTGPKDQLSFHTDGTLAATDDGLVSRLYNVTDPAKVAPVGVDAAQIWMVETTNPAGGAMVMKAVPVDQVPGADPRDLLPFAAGPDSRHAALVTADGTVALPGNPPTLIEAKLSHPQAVAVAANGDVYAETDQGLSIWHTDAKVLHAAACKLGPMAESQWRLYFPGLDYRSPC
jgi:hypothetical protein